MFAIIVSVSYTNLVDSKAYPRTTRNLPQLNTILESFSDCLINLINFNNLIFTQMYSTPVILTDGQKTIPKIHLRRFSFCTVNLFLFPEDRNRTKFPKSLWIPSALTRTGPHYQEDDVESTTDNKFLTYLEPHYLLIISTSLPSKSIKDLMRFNTNSHSTIYVFQVSKGLNDYKKPDYHIKTITYICKFCHSRFFVETVLPIPTNLMLIKSYLDEMEKRITGHGSYIYVQFGPQKGDKSSLKFKDYLVDSKKGVLKTLNPFGKNVNGTDVQLDIQKIVQIILFQTFNIGINLSDSLGLNDFKVSYHKPIFNRRPRINFQDSRREKLLFQRSYTIVDKVTFNFITCDGVIIPSRQNLVDLTRLLSPLDSMIWLLVLSGLIVIPGVALQFTRLLQKQSGEELSYGFYFNLVFGSLLENGRDLNIQKQFLMLPGTLASTVYVVLAAWLAFLFLVSNLYKGVLTSDEMSHEHVESKYTKIHELVNFSIVTPTFPDVSLGKTDSSLALSNSLFGVTLFYLAQMVRRDKYEYKYPHIFNFINRINSPSIDKVRKRRSLHHPNGNNRVLPSENRTEILGFISNCNRTAFIHENSKIDYFLNYFNSESQSWRNQTVFMKGKDEFLSPNFGWMISSYSDVYMGRVYTRLQSLIHSGIYNLYQKWIDLRRNGFKQNGESKHEKFVYHAVTLRSQVTLLIILTAGEVVSDFVFIYELLANRFTIRETKVTVLNLHLRAYSGVVW